MSSHREAPEISKDPVADSTDLYAFVSPDADSTVTLIANYIPLEAAAGGPNFYEFGTDVQYDILIDNDGDGLPDLIYRFEFTTTVANPDTFLYNTGPIFSLDSPNWNRKQTYQVSLWNDSGWTVLGQDLPCPPCNIGPLSTNEYGTLASEAVRSLGDGTLVFAGQRAEGFYVDLGSIFDLGNLRPLQEAHTTFGQNLPVLSHPALGVNATDKANVHSIALQVPKTALTARGYDPTNPTDSRSTIGVWTAASRQRVIIREHSGAELEIGPWVQVSRLGNPLINEVVIPMGQKDYWNAQAPAGDSQFNNYVLHPELAGLLPVLYPGAFPHLAALVSSRASRTDLQAILMTGIPPGIIPGFQNYTGSTIADMLRLNMAYPPASTPNTLGLLGNDVAGYPNGRRVFDDVVTIELQAIAGRTYPLVHPSYTPDAVVPSVTDGLTASPTDTTAKGTEDYLSTFPYLGVPHSGYFDPAHS